MVVVVGQVTVIDGRLTPYKEFRDKFMKANLPVLLTGLMDDWPASKDWLTPTGQPNLDYLSANFGNSRVQVADCSTRDFTDQKRLDMTVAEYITYWKNRNKSLNTANHNGSLLYLKDWHFVKDYPQYTAYQTPKFFMDDWLNFYLEQHELHLSNKGSKKDPCLSDYRFVYMGPKGTWTPLHADVFRSYSWSGNVCGRKVWHLLPPSETHLVYDRHMRHSVYDIYGDVSPTEFPNFHRTTWLECIQDKGEVLFVPSGWYHQVTNLEDTISINHNWFNGYNLEWVWKLLLADSEKTRESIEDIRLIADNFEELCERNLAANSGMNMYDFFTFLSRMSTFFFTFLRRSGIENKNNENGTRYFCRNLLLELIFNLKSIARVANYMDAAGLDTVCSSTDHKYTDKDMNASDAPLSLIKEGEDIIWSDWTNSSEYFNFLIDICSQSITQRRHGVMDSLCLIPMNISELINSNDSCNRNEDDNHLKSKSNSPKQLGQTITNFIENVETCL